MNFYQKALMLSDLAYILATLAFKPFDYVSEAAQSVVLSEAWFAGFFCEIIEMFRYLYLAIPSTVMLHFSATFSSFIVSTMSIDYARVATSPQKEPWTQNRRRRILILNTLATAAMKITVLAEKEVRNEKRLLTCNILLEQIRTHPECMGTLLQYTLEYTSFAKKPLNVAWRYVEQSIQLLTRLLCKNQRGQ